VQQLTLQGIFRQHFTDYAKERKLPLRALQAASAITNCRTPMMGGHVQACPQGHIERIQYHSCRHRSCAQCSRLPRAQWADAQAARLLDCDHYHVVFTLPPELLGLWEYNRAWMARALFAAARATLMQLLQDPRFLGATPGLVMALHTWGRTLNHHPHVHCLVSGGGLSAGGEWKGITNGYLLPVRVVKALFRGKLLGAIAEGLRDQRLRQVPSVTAVDWARTRRALSTKNWNVYLRERYPHGQGVLRYLARYVKGGPIADTRLRTTTAASVTFSYQDHRDGQHKTMTLAASEFLARLLWHVPEPRQHTIRHYGLYAAQSARRRARARAHLGQPEATAIETSWQTTLARLGRGDRTNCPRCGQRLVRGERLARTGRWDENSLFKTVPNGFAQLRVQADTPNVLSLTKTAPSDADDIFLRGGVRLN
jgi:hypothetical protein